MMIIVLTKKPYGNDDVSCLLDEGDPSSRKGSHRKKKKWNNRSMIICAKHFSDSSFFADSQKSHEKTFHFVFHHTM